MSSAIQVTTARSNTRVIRRVQGIGPAGPPFNTPASTTTQGVIALHTTAEAQAGTAIGKAMDALRTAEAIAVQAPVAPYIIGTDLASRSATDRAKDKPHVLDFVVFGDTTTGSGADFGPVFQRAMNSGYSEISAQGNARLPIRTQVHITTPNVRLCGATVTTDTAIDVFRISSTGVNFDDFDGVHTDSGKILFFDDNAHGCGGKRIRLQAGDPTNNLKVGDVFYVRGSYGCFDDIIINGWRASGHMINIDALAGQFNLETVLNRPRVAGAMPGVIVQTSDGSKRPEGVQLNHVSLISEANNLELRAVLDFSIKGGTIDLSRDRAIYLNPQITTAGETGIEEIDLDLAWIGCEESSTPGVGGTAISVEPTAPGYVVGLRIPGRVTQAHDGIVLAPNCDGVTLTGAFTHIAGTAFKSNGATNVTLTGSQFRDVGTNLDLSGAGTVTVGGCTLEAGKAITLDAGNRDKYTFRGNTGARTDGFCAATSGTTAGGTSGNFFLNIPHGLASTPAANRIVFGAPQAVTGAFVNLTANVISADATNILVNIYWDGIVTNGTIQVSAFASI